MGESIVEAPIAEDKMRGSAIPDSTLEVSVSFGRFENDSLSWEKWSSFSPNKYLEEVEKCATPGSVAQKKAYFEAHYKKIAARKAEEMEQEKQMEANCLIKDDNYGGNHVKEPSEDNNQSCEGVEQTNNLHDVKNSSCYDESKESSSITIDSQCSIMDGTIDSGSSIINELKEDVGCVPNDLELNKLEEPILAQEETQVNGIQEEIELPQVIVEELARVDGSQDKVQSRKIWEKNIGKTPESKKEEMNLGASQKSTKMTSSDKERNLAGMKKKLVPHSAKTFPQNSTPKTTKSTSASSKATPSRSSTNRANGSSLTRSTNFTAVKSKKMTPSPMYMSLSLGPTSDNSTSITTTSRSLLMETMGDKDIIKRAFKTFQSNFNQGRASGDTRSTEPKEVSTTKIGQKLSTSLTLRKENERMRKGEGKMDSQRAQLGRSLNASTARSLKGVGMDQRRAKPAPSSFGLRSDERAGKQRDFLKKGEEKTSTQEAENARFSSKSKEEEAEIKKFRQNLNFKATPMPGFYQGHSVSKSSLDKEGAKKECQRRSETRK